MNKPLEPGDADTASSDNRRSGPIDRRVGQRLRLRRQILGFSAEEIAQAIGITQQQLQKYESAQNRVSAGRLFQLAQALDTSVAYFYEDAQLEELSADNDPHGDGSRPNSAELSILIDAFYKIDTSVERRSVIELAIRLARRDI